MEQNMSEDTEPLGNIIKGIKKNEIFKKIKGTVR